jgi:hypothetical protein
VTLLFAFAAVTLAAAPDLQSRLNQNVIVVEFAEDATIAADTFYPSSGTRFWLSNSQGYNFDKADVFYDIDGATATQTVDIVLQTSWDGTNWAVHSDSGIGSQLTADMSVPLYETVDVEGRFYRIKLDLATTDTITVADLNVVLH